MESSDMETRSEDRQNLIRGLYGSREENNSDWM